MKKKYLKAMNCTLVHNKLYFVCSELNIIYTLNIDTSEIEFMEKLPEEPMLQNNLYGNICYHCGKLIIVPLCAEKIWIYDFSEEKWNGIELLEEEKKIPYKFFGAAIYKEYVYLFGHYYPGIIRLNLNSYSTERIKILDERIDIENKNKDGFFNWDYVMKENWLYTPILQTNQILKLELETGSYELISVGDRENQYVGIVWDGDAFWLAPRKNGVYVKWDGYHQVIEYSLPSEFNQRMYYFGGSYLNGNKVVFCGFAGKTMEFTIEHPENALIQDRNIIFCKKINNMTQILQEDNGGIYIQRQNEEEKRIDCFFDIDKLEEILQKYLFETEESSMIKENSVVSLETWTRFITKKSNTNAEQKNVGKKIYSLTNLEEC